MSQSSPHTLTIFAEALECASEQQRVAHLDRACAGDRELRACVEGLLRAHHEAGKFLDGAAFTRQGSTGFDENSFAERPGAMIGPYKLLEQIGEGGFGIVFMAEQVRPLRRQVALKVVKPGMDSRQVVARFEAERQALALMDHPNIAHVLDAGETTSGRPYFVMELVQGVPITEYCDQCNLTTRERLELFVSVCQAVQHAHQKGVIHRDIKPTNVLVSMQDGRPAPKIIDFGVAKAINQRLTENSLATGYAQVIGTPMYMSPEQAELSALGVDTRADIYSLGVLLYELLTGTTPFQKERLHAAPFDELRRIIREEEPPRPSERLSTLAADLTSTVAERRRTDARRLWQMIRGDLDWIVMKCLDKDRNRRYDSASSLAEDIERYLNNEPVQAYPPSARYRLRKFVRRNKVAAAFVALLLVSVAALGISNLAIKRERDAKATALAQVTAESAKAQATLKLLQQMIASANPDEVKGIDYTVRQLLDDFSAEIGNELEGKPEVEAHVRATIGLAYRKLGIADKAQSHLERALALRRRVYGTQHELVAQSLAELASNQRQTSQLAEAEANVREALDIYRKLGTGGQPVLYAYSTLQLILSNAQRYSESEAVAKEALLLAARTPETEFPEVASLLHGLAGAENRQSKFVEAEKHAREAVRLHRRLRGPYHPELAWALITLSVPLRNQGKYEEAESTAREALAIFRRHYSEDHKYIQMANKALKFALESAGKREELDALLREEAEAATRKMENVSRTKEQAK
ncbi:MAG: serine/threonine-protein kinase [Pirellulales bacterium]